MQGPNHVDIGFRIDGSETTLKVELARCSFCVQPLGEMFMDIPAPIIAYREGLELTWVQALDEHGFSPQPLNKPSDLASTNAEVLILDTELLEQFPLIQWQHRRCTALLLDDDFKDTSFDNNVCKNKQAGAMACLRLPKSATKSQMLQAIQFAVDHTRLSRRTELAENQNRLTANSLSRLVQVGIALSAEADLDSLLEKILAEGQQLVGCDAASLFLLDTQENTSQLRFKLTRNQSLEVPFAEHCLALDKSSIAGFCACTGETLHIEDVYCLPDNSPYRFNRSFDQSMAYRTVNLVVLPMVDQNGNVVGILEFINRKRNISDILDVPSLTPERLIAFDEEAIALLQAMASQAAVAIEKSRLIDSVNKLFEGFVQASVFAIERRDPTTSGHSFRVADLCESVATAVDTCDAGSFKVVQFNHDDMRELRYAALLHDFGKVGVREHILVKAKKLSPGNCERLRYRVALAQAQLRNQSLEQMLKLSTSPNGLSDVLRREIELANEQDIKQLSDYLEVILQANEPTVLSRDVQGNLDLIKSHLVRDSQGTLSGLISEKEYQALRIKRGSLSEPERLEIEAHVQHTIDFLSLIPWTPNLSGIPGIAGAHHEKLDGSGYPYNLSEQKIPFPSRIMTVCDIFDALTASDRPYKPAMPLERALDILRAEAQRGIVDTHIVELFIEARCYTALEGREYGFSLPCQSKDAQWVHHVCDYDLHKAQDTL